eukprot:TRINITY_DN7394_c0_g1_i1.p1 TRINITY_DN7394_c0_g1~~TRINITY_DN7394_c0_g1_i1.p1  ORF type:complete len:823 (-),score=76.90 TRINITY_DN7394_c0_g1_i1:73-2322(-)
MASTLLLNAHIAESHTTTTAATSETQKPVLVCLQQLFGAGKTKMGLQFQRRLKILCDKQPKQRAAWEQEFGAETLKNLLDAQYVQVDLCKAKAYRGARQMLGQAVYKNLAACCESNTSLGLPQPIAFDVDDVVESFLKTNKNTSVFLHFDEVGRIEEPDFDDVQDDWRVARPEPPTLEQKLKRYYATWQALFPLLGMRRVFVLASCKQTAFSLIGRQVIPSLRSPSDAVHIHLEPLNQENVAQIAHGTEIFGRSLFRCLCELGLTKELLAHLCDEIILNTGGLPRLVQNTFGAILHNRPALNSTTSISDIFALGHPVLKTILEIWQYNASADPRWSDIYMHLIVRTSLGLGLPNEMLCPETDRVLPIDYFIDRLSLYMRKDGAELVFGNIVIRKFLATTRSHISANVDMANIPTFLVSKGSLLEYLVIRMLQSRLVLSPAKLVSEAFQLPNSQLLQLAMVPTAPLGSYLLPKITIRTHACTDIETIKAKLSGAWDHQVHPNNWPDLINLWPANTIAIPAPLSSSPDVLYRTDTAIVGWQVKFVKTLGWTDLQREIEKCTPITKGLPLCLVFLATSYGKEITQVVEQFQSHLYLQSGFYVQNEDKSKLVLAPLGTTALVTVPAQMEVVLLNSAGVESLLGKTGTFTLQAYMAQQEYNSLGARIPVTSPTQSTPSGEDTMDPAKPVAEGKPKTGGEPVQKKARTSTARTPDTMSYRQLQIALKKLGQPANGKTEVLRARLKTAIAEGKNPK